MSNIRLGHFEEDVLAVAATMRTVRNGAALGLTIAAVALIVTLAVLA